MLNKIENLSIKIIEKLDLQGRKLREFMMPGEVFLTNARTGRSEAEQETPLHPLFRVYTAYEQVEWYKDTYDSIRVIPTTFNIFGKPLLGYAALVGIPKQPPAQTA